MQSASASAAFWGAFAQAEMHTGATSGVAPTEAVRQPATAEPSPAAPQCSSPTRQSPRRRLSGLFSKLALLAVVALAALPSAAACSHGETQRHTLEQHGAVRRLQQAAGAPTAASGYPSVDFETAKRLAEANNVAAQPQGRRSLSAPRTCAYDDDAEASADAEVSGTSKERRRAATVHQLPAASFPVSRCCRSMLNLRKAMSGRATATESYAEVLPTHAQPAELQPQIYMLTCCQPDMSLAVLTGRRSCSHASTTSTAAAPAAR